MTDESNDPLHHGVCPCKFVDRSFHLNVDSNIIGSCDPLRLRNGGAPIRSQVYEKHALRCSEYFRWRIEGLTSYLCTSQWKVKYGGR